MNHPPLPHHDLLDEVQLCVIPIVHELPGVAAGIKWVKSTIDGTQDQHPIGCMLFSEEAWKSENQIEKLSRLNTSVKALKNPLKLLYAKINDFSNHHTKIERSLFALNAVYVEMPIIEPEIQLLKLGQTLFEEPDMVLHLSDYIDKTKEVLKKASALKHNIFNEVISSLSFTLDTSEEDRLFEI